MRSVERVVSQEYVRAAARAAPRMPLPDAARLLMAYDLDREVSVPELAAAAGIGSSTLTRMASRAGLRPRSSSRRRRVSDAELLRTVALVRLRGGYSAAARELGLHWTSVRERCERAGHARPWEAGVVDA